LERIHAGTHDVPRKQDLETANQDIRDFIKASITKEGQAAKY
jgi:hypothetical protein